MNSGDSIKSIAEVYTKEVKQKQYLEEAVKLPISRKSRMPKGVKKEDIRDFADSLKADRKAVAIANEIYKMAPKFARSLEAGGEYAPDETPEYSYEDIVKFREKMGKKNKTLDAILNKAKFDFINVLSDAREAEPVVVRGNISANAYSGDILTKKDVEEAGGYVKVLGWIVFLIESRPRKAPPSFDLIDFK